MITAFFVICSLLFFMFLTTHVCMNMKVTGFSAGLCAIFMFSMAGIGFGDTVVKLAKLINI